MDVPALGRGVESPRVDLALNRGETFAIVGESGSGKTTLARLIVGLESPTSGRIVFNGSELAALGSDRALGLRRRIQVVFQDPSGSLNPRKTIRRLLEEPLIVHGLGDWRARSARVKELLDVVELPVELLDRYPHNLSGGQKQRVGIGRALATGPDLLILDEPTSALDVSVQAKIVALLRKLQHEFDLTYLFISHDLSLVRAFANRIGVMYLGYLVEVGEAPEVFSDPAQPYTRELLASIPTLDELEIAEASRPATGIQGWSTTSAAGCVFNPRCPHVMPQCRTAWPQVHHLTSSHWVKCYLSENLHN